MRLERGLDDAALNAAPASVNQPDNFESRVDRSAQVFVRDRLHVTRCERMEVQRRLDRNPMGHENAEGRNSKYRIRIAEFNAGLELRTKNSELRTRFCILNSAICILDVTASRAFDIER